MEEEKKNVSEQMERDAFHSRATAAMRSDNWENSQIKKGADGSTTVEKKDSVLSEQDALIQKAGLFAGIREILESTFDREYTESFEKFSSESITASFDALQEDINKYLHAIDYASEEDFNKILEIFGAAMSSDKFSPSAREEVLEILRKQRELKLSDRNRVRQAKKAEIKRYEPKIEAIKIFGKDLGELTRATDEEVAKAIKGQKQLSQDIIGSLKGKKKEFKGDIHNLKGGDLSDAEMENQKDLIKKIEEQENKVKTLVQQHNDKKVSLTNVEIAETVIGEFQTTVKLPNIELFKTGKTRVEKSSPKKYIKDVKEEFEATLNRTKKYLEKKIAESTGKEVQVYQSAFDSLQTKADEFSSLLTSAGSVKTKQQAQLALSFQDKFKDTFAPVLHGVKSEVTQLLGVTEASSGPDFFKDVPALIESKKNELENERKIIYNEYQLTQEVLSGLKHKLIENQQLIGRLEESKSSIKPSIKEEKGSVGRLKDELEQWAAEGATPFTLLKSLAKENLRIKDFKIYDDERKLAIELLKEAGIENPTEQEIDERSLEIELVRQLGGVELKKQPKVTPLVSAPSGPDDPRKVDGEVYTLVVTKDTYKNMGDLINRFIAEYPDENKPKEFKGLVDKLGYVASALDEIEEIIKSTSVTIDGFAQGDEEAKETENILQNRIEAIAGAHVYSTIFGRTFSTSKSNLSQVRDVYREEHAKKGNKFNETITGKLVNVLENEKLAARAFLEQDRVLVRENRAAFVDEQTARIIKNVVVKNVAEMVGAFRTSKGTGGVFESVLNNIYVEAELQEEYKRVLEHPSLFALRYKNGIQSALKYQEEIKQLTTIYEDIDKTASLLEEREKLETSEANKNTIEEYRSEISALKDSVALIYGDIYLREANKTLSNMRADTKVADVKDLITLRSKRRAELAPHILSALMFGEYDELKNIYLLSDESIKLWSEKFPALYVKEGEKYTFISKEGKPKHVVDGEPIDRDVIEKLAKDGKFRQIYSIYTDRLKRWESINRINQYRSGISTEASDMYVKTFGGNGPEYKKLTTGTVAGMDRENIDRAASETEAEEYRRELAVIRSRAVVYTLFKNAMVAHEMEDAIEAVFKGFTSEVKESIMSKMYSELKGDATSLDELKIGSLNKEQIEALKTSVQASFEEQKAVVTNKPGQKSYENISNSLTTMLDNLTETLDSNSKIILTEKTGFLNKNITEIAVDRLNENDPEKITTEQVLTTLDEMIGEGFKHDDKELKKQGLTSKDVEKFKTADEMNRVKMFIVNVRGMASTAAAETAGRVASEPAVGVIERVTPEAAAILSEADVLEDSNVPAGEGIGEEVEAEASASRDGSLGDKKKKEITVGGKAVYGKATDEAKKLAAALIAYAKSREKYYADKASAAGDNPDTADGNTVEEFQENNTEAEIQDQNVILENAGPELVYGGLTVSQVQELLKTKGIKYGIKPEGMLEKWTGDELAQYEEAQKSLNDLRKDMFWMSLLHTARNMVAICENPDILNGTLSDSESAEMKEFVATYLTEENKKNLSQYSEQFKGMVDKLEKCAGVVEKDEESLSQQDKETARRTFITNSADEKEKEKNIDVDMLAWAGYKNGAEIGEFKGTQTEELNALLLDENALVKMDQNTPLITLYMEEDKFKKTKDEMVKAMVQNLQKVYSATDALTINKR